MSEHGFAQTGVRPVHVWLLQQKDTPMQWNSGPDAGFTTGAPWLPVETDYRTRSVKTEQDDRHSLYSGMRGCSNCGMGDYVPLESGNLDMLAFGRRAGSAGNRQGTGLIVLNMSAQPQTVAISGFAGARPRFDLLASPPATIPASGSFAMMPYGVLIGTTN